MMTKRISLEPDPDMRWIYDRSHRDYNTDRARDLRNSRSWAISSVPEWMREEARLNDLMRERDDD